MPHYYPQNSLFSKIGWLIVFTLLLSSNFRSQNLVADSSFERNSAIPLLLSAINTNVAWSTPSWGTTDLFCKCGKKQQKISEAQVPFNPFGYQEAHSGNCYAGIYAFSHGDYREYLLTELSSPLNAGENYMLSMYVSLADYSRVTVDQLGVCFLNSKVTYSNSEVIKNVKPIYINIEEDIADDTVYWHQLTLNYLAHGGEKFLLIGSFVVNDIKPTDVKAPKNIRTKINQRTERDAYYFFDDISLYKEPPPLSVRIDTTESNEPPLPDSLFVQNPIKEEVKVDTLISEKPLVLKNVLFESNEAILLPGSFTELDSIVRHLTRNPKYDIEITGHTDNVGNEEQNKLLSEKRAKAVAEYLIKNDISELRIKYIGYGSLKPIATNDSEEGRKQNRRVEFMFMRR